MSVLLRLWTVFLIAFCAFVTAFGMQPGFGKLWWPVAGLWAAAVLAPFGLSVWAAACLIVLGVLMDFMSEAPMGAWPLALLSAYGVALVAWDRSPPIPVWAAELVSVLGGLVAAGIALMLAGSASGHAGFARGAFTSDFLLTAALYPVVRFLLSRPTSVRARQVLGYRGDEKRLEPQLSIPPRDLPCR